MFTGFYGYDIYFVVLILPVILLSGLVHIKLMLTYSKFSRVFNSKHLTGAMAARNILDKAGLVSVRIERIGGSLTDHFDPRSNVLRLSSKNYDDASIAAVGVAAHEAGHAIQFAEDFFPMKIRSKAVVLTRFGSSMCFPIMLVGLVLSIFQLVVLAIVLFSFTVVFEFVTLPVEFDASFRAIRILKSQQILNSEELVEVKKVLWAAAMTYVASFLMAFVQLLRFVLLFLQSRRND